MPKSFRFVDVQFAASSGLALDDARAANLALFATYEPLRLWLKEHEVAAPFRKLAVTFADARVAAPWHGHVANVRGVCEVTEAVEPRELAERAADHRWLLAGVQHALSRVNQSLGWRSELFEQALVAFAASEWPQQHVFDRFAKTDRRTGLRCVPWMSLRPGETTIGVHVGERAIPLRCKAGPLYLEDEFPLSKTAIRDGRFLLLDKAGATLASVAIIPD